ncbi:MAG: glucose-6-phosphate dehydrogenase assembly protein OpcA [Acidimicrobiales bacterium]
MAQPLSAGAAASVSTDLGSWRGEGVGMGQVVEALNDLRRSAQHAATRTSVVSLIVVAPDDALANRAAEAVRALAGCHPGRTVVVVCRPGDEPRLDAEVALHADEAQGHQVWSEDVRLWVRGPLGRHLDSLVEPLTLPDLPVVVWFTGSPPGPSEPLLGPADAVVVDTKEPAPAHLAAVAALDHRHTVLDLAWIRLTPWRTLLAGMFEMAALRPFLAGVHRAEVSGKPGARLLLGGWLVSRLGLPVDAVALAPGRHAAITLHAEHEGRRAEVRVGRTEGERAVWARGDIDGRPDAEDRLALADDSMAWSLAEALTHLRRDRAHAQALQAALALAATT